MIEKTIYYHDTDAIGIAYYSAYLKILEEGRTHFFQSRGLSVKGLHEQGTFFVIKELNVKYKSPARFGYIVICDSIVSKITEAQIFFSQKIYNKEDNSILATAEITLVITDKYCHPIAIPETVRAISGARSPKGKNPVVA